MIGNLIQYLHGGVDMDELIRDMAASPLFDGIEPDDLKAMLGCMGYHVTTFLKDTRPCAHASASALPGR